MDLSYGPEYETFREEVRDFIAVNRHLAPKNAGRAARPSNEGVAWQKLLIEHGYDQAAAVRDELHKAGLSDVASWQDLARIERVSGGRLR